MQENLFRADCSGHEQWTKPTGHTEHFCIVVPFAGGNTTTEKMSEDSLDFQIDGCILSKHAWHDTVGNVREFVQSLLLPRQTNMDSRGHGFVSGG